MQSRQPIRGARGRQRHGDGIPSLRTLVRDRILNYGPITRSFQQYLTENNSILTQNPANKPNMHIDDDTNTNNASFFDVFEVPRAPNSARDHLSNRANSLRTSSNSSKGEHAHSRPDPEGLHQSDGPVQGSLRRQRILPDPPSVQFINGSIPSPQKHQNRGGNSPNLPRLASSPRQKVGSNKQGGQCKVPERERGLPGSFNPNQSASIVPQPRAKSSNGSEPCPNPNYVTELQSKPNDNSSDCWEDCPEQSTKGQGQASFFTSKSAFSSKEHVRFSYATWYLYQCYLS